MLDQILIPISGLKLGHHEFNFILNKKFFDQFSNINEVQGEFEVKITLEKSELLIRTHFEIIGNISLDCARCNDPIDNPLEINASHIFKLSSSILELNDDNISVITHDTFELDLTYLVYELIILSIPVRPLHNDGDCNKNTLEILEEILKKSNKSELADPRWSKLNEFK
jgi:uncharacterized protein